MRTTTGPAHAPHSSLVSNQERGQAIKNRRLDLGVQTPAEAAAASGVDYKTYVKAEDGNPSTRPSTYDRIEAWLASEDAENVGHVSPELPAEPIRIEMHGVYGIDQIIVTGPVDRPDELAETIGKVMDRIRAQAEGS